MNSIATLSSRSARAVSALAGLFAVGLLSSVSEAQPAGRPAAPAAAQPAPAAAAPAQASAAAEPAPSGRGPNPVVIALTPQPGGLTPDDVGKLAIQTSASIRVKQADLQAASAKVDQALVNYFPRLTVAATYTRLSEVDSDIDTGGYILGTTTPGFPRVIPCPDNPTEQCVAAQASTLSFPTLNNSYSFTANLVVPISDYVLRTSQGYAAASHSEKAKKLDADAEALQVAADAKNTFYNWVQAKGQLVVSHEAVEQAKAHVVDARRTFDVGLISRADVLGLEAQVASAEQVEAQSLALLLVSEEQLRVAIGVQSDKVLEIGIDVMGVAPTPPPASLQALQKEALEKRIEIRALDETVYSLKESESVNRAAYIPRLDAFADLTYANPNTRIFPQKDQFDLTWDAGLRLSWTINDALTASGTTAEAKARTQSVVEQKALLRDQLRIEVASAYYDVQKSTSTIESAERQLAAAEESMRVRNELFRAGRATSVDVVDADADVTNARLAQVSARVGLLVAKTRLEHATGRDIK